MPCQHPVWLLAAMVYVALYVATLIGAVAVLLHVL